jgi:hypothetical protein
MVEEMQTAAPFLGQDNGLAFTLRTHELAAFAAVGALFAPVAAILALFMPRGKRLAAFLTEPMYDFYIYGFKIWIHYKFAISIQGLFDRLIFRKDSPPEIFAV